MSKSRKTISLILLVCALVLAVFIFVKFKSGQRTASKIDLHTVREGLSHFLDIEFAPSKTNLATQDVVEITCNRSNNCTPKLTLDKSHHSYGLRTWLINAMVTRYKISPNKQQKIIDEALELTSQLVNSSGNVYNTQAFVLMDAYLATHNNRFLLAFLISTQSLVLHSIDDIIFSQAWIKKDHPMNLVRFAEQIMLVADLFKRIDPSTLETLDLNDPELKLFEHHKIMHSLMITSKARIVEQSLEIAKKFLDAAEKASKHDSSYSLTSNNQDFNNSVCWLAYGYSSVSEMSDNIELRNHALRMLKEAGLDSGDFTNKNISSLQSIIPCINAYKILSKKESSNSIAVKESIRQVASRFLDSTESQPCFGTGGLLAESPSSVNLYSSVPNGLCQSARFNIADNSWFFSTISDLENFDIYPVSN